MKKSDAEIIEGCRRKDPVYEGLLVEKYAAVLLTVGRRYSRNREEAEDVLQDAFIKIFEHFHQYQAERGTLDSWMRTIVIRTALRDYRKKYPLLDKLDPLQNNYQHPEPGIIEKLKEEDLLSIIAKLPEGYRQVFNLFVIDGFSHREIADLLNIKESSSRSQLTRAKTMLKKKLSHYQKNTTCSTTALAIALGLN